MFTTEGLAMIATSIIFGILSGVSVVLRIYAQTIKKRPDKRFLRTGDYFMIAAWVFSAALVATNITGALIGGFGLSYKQLVEEKKAKIFLQLLFILQFWYIIALGLVKLSILFFYGVVFSAGKLNVTIKIMLLVTVSWMISFILATLFQIWPIRCNWTSCVRGSATDYPIMYILNNATDIILDIAILCLPVTSIKRLRMSRNKKIGTMFIFGLGIFCIVSSIARLVYVIRYQKTQLTGDFEASFDSNVVNFIMWSGIEACASVICANLPCYAPLWGNRPWLEDAVSRVIRRCTFSLPKVSTWDFKPFGKLARGTKKAPTAKLGFGKLAEEIPLEEVPSPHNPLPTPRKSLQVNTPQNALTASNIYEETDTPTTRETQFRLGELPTRAMRDSKGESCNSFRGVPIRGQRWKLGTPII